MTKNVVAARSNAPVTEIITLMVKFNLGTVPIVDSKNIPVGIITDGDVVREAAVGKGISPLLNTGDIISASFIAMNPETP
ncbi:MAG TPA: CBS domain-containing protein, partial [Nitrososphaerales archaeon]|nr:CBS domain-containing protein [Nitrososphaerales archaeon]